jgi:hypothetical protein
MVNLDLDLAPKCREMDLLQYLHRHLAHLLKHDAGECKRVLIFEVQSSAKKRHHHERTLLCLSLHHMGASPAAIAAKFRNFIAKASTPWI